jgi:hypothetical protein
MNINGWEMTIPLAFFAGTGYIFFIRTNFVTVKKSQTALA